MNNLLINGKACIASGVVMIPPNVDAAVAIPGGILNFRFTVDGEPGYNWNNWTLTVNAAPNPMGIALTVELPQSEYKVARVVMTVHTVGEGDIIHRIVHYTIY